MPTLFSKRRFIIKKIYLLVFLAVFAAFGAANSEEQYSGPFEGQVKTTQEYDIAYQKLHFHGVIIVEGDKKAVITIEDGGMRNYEVGQKLVVVNKSIRFEFSVSEISRSQITIRSENGKIYKGGF